MLRPALLSLALTAVSQFSVASETATPWAKPAVGAASAHTVVSADGARIRYDDQGAGELTLVFVHGWACDRSYWHAQRDYFAKSHRVVTLDLAGHGGSDPDRAQWTMQAFGQDVAAVVTALDLTNVVLIGHSMGGKVVVEAASQLGGRIVAIVGVDTLHNGGRETPRARHDQILAELAKDHPGYMRTLVDRMFVEISDPALLDFIMADMTATPYHVAVGARIASGSYDAAVTLASLDVPLILINSDYMPTDLAHLSANAHALTYRAMSGVGHFVMLEDPVTFNAHLAAALADLH